MRRMRCEFVCAADELVIPLECGDQNHGRRSGIGAFFQRWGCVGNTGTVAGVFYFVSFCSLAPKSTRFNFGKMRRKPQTASIAHKTAIYRLRNAPSPQYHSNANYIVYSQISTLDSTQHRNYSMVQFHCPFADYLQRCPGAFSCCSRSSGTPAILALSAVVGTVMDRQRSIPFSKPARSGEVHECIVIH